MDKVDTIIFFKRKEKDLVIIQTYVDDIIFGATNATLCEEFANLVKKDYEMSMMGELSFFLGFNLSKKIPYLHKSI